MHVEKNLKEAERVREAYWRRYPGTSPVKLRWRALTVRHSFHVLPGEKILELGAGSGLWTEHLNAVMADQNPITAVVFNEEYAAACRARKLPTLEVCLPESLNDLPADTYDYVVGTLILCHTQYPQTLAAIRRVLKPSGQIMFFESNYWNPQVFLKTHIPFLARLCGHAKCQIAMRQFKLMQMASAQGFTHVDIIPYDILHPRTPRFLINFLQNTAFILEHAPLIHKLCGTLYIWARKPGDETERRPTQSLACHQKLFGSTSFVIPCHNEEMNIARLVHTLVTYLDEYIHEIIIVNDNSRDRTGEVAAEIARDEPRVKVVNREPPNGVGRALRDGYAAATGKYILTMDSDFVQIVPEFPDLFEAVAEGFDGAIGSRFSQESVLINYPFFKILCNRGFHLLANLMLPQRFRDISNNLKLYRAEILQNLDIEEDHFAANAETGLKPILQGYKIKEVPISWINRTVEMGTTSFRIALVGPRYFVALMRMVWKAWRGDNMRVVQNSNK